MKKTLISVLLAVCFVFTFIFAACNNANSGENPPVTPPEESKVNIDNKFTVTSNILVVYFSKTNTTESVALKIQELTNADIFEVERKEPYPDAYTPTTEVAKEEKDANARPELKTYVPKDVVESYETIFVGFPIWWHTAPMIIGTFLEHYDLTGVDVYPFSQSASMNTTQFDTSMEFVRGCAAKIGTPIVHEGLFARASSASAIDSYLSENGFIA